MKQILQSFLHLLPGFFSEKNHRIFLTYLKLYVASYIHHHLGKNSKEEKHARILGYTISFLNYPVLINQFEEIFIFKAYRFTSTNKKPLIFDCGSNIGMSVLYFKIFYPESKIVAFEPDPENFTLLKKNMTQNGFVNVSLHEVALGKEDGICRLYRQNAASGSLNSSIVENVTAENFIDVSMKKLSSFIDSEIDFLKMDVEGAEVEILQELHGAGKIRKIINLVVEIHSMGKEEKLSLILNPKGFPLQYHMKTQEGSFGSLLNFKRV